MVFSKIVLTYLVLMGRGEVVIFVSFLVTFGLSYQGQAKINLPINMLHQNTSNANSMLYYEFEIQELFLTNLNLG